MHKTFLTAVFVTVSSFSAHAATITWGSSLAHGLALSNSATLLPTGNFVRLGYFDDGYSDAMIASDLNAGGVNAVDLKFNQIDVARIGDGASNSAGFFAASENFTVTSGLAGKQMAMWVFFSQDTSSLLTAQNTVQQTGIFYLSTAAQNGAWAIPSDNPTPGTTSIDLNQLTGNTGASGNLSVPDAHLVYGSYSANAFGPANSRNFLLAAVVPEPSSAVFLLAGLGAFGLRRFRRL